MIIPETPAQIADRIVNRENTALVEANRDFWRQRIEQSITVAVSAERERCAEIAESEEARYRQGGAVSSIAEEVYGALAAKEIAAAKRSCRTIIRSTAIISIWPTVRSIAAIGTM